MLIQPIFRIRNLVVAYNQKVILDVPQLDIPRGKLIFLLGKCGSGKTTFLESVGLLSSRRSSASQIVFYPAMHSDGIEYNTLWKNQEVLADFRRKHFTFMFQDARLFPGFTVVENLILMQLVKGRSYHDASSAAEARLAELGLTHLSGRFGTDISGGERQRVCFAQAALGAEYLLLADEPTGNLDEENAARVISDIQGFVKRPGSLSTAIVVSHNIRLALDYADEIIAIQFNHRIAEHDSVATRLLNSASWCVNGAAVPSIEKHLTRVMNVEDAEPVRTVVPVEAGGDGSANLGMSDNKEFTRFYGRKTTRELSLWKWENWITVALILIGFSAIGLSSGSLAVLGDKLDDPFVNYIFAPFNEELMKVFSDSQAVRQEFAVGGVYPYHMFVLNVFSSVQSMDVQRYGRSVVDTEKIVSQILRVKQNAGTTFQGRHDLGIIVTQEFLELSNLDTTALFVPLARGTSDGWMSFPIPIRAIVQDLPEQSQFMTTQYFHDAWFDGKSFSPSNSKRLMLFVAGSKSEALALESALKAFLLSADSPKRSFKTSSVYKPADDARPYKEGHVVDVAFEQEIDWRTAKQIFESFLGNVAVSQKPVLLYSYPDTSQRKVPHGPFEAMAIHLQDLGHVNELQEFAKKFGVRLEMGQIEERSNYQLVSKLTYALSGLTIILSVVSVCIFVGYVFYLHLYKNRKYLGMLTAYGASPRSLKRMYFKRALSSLLVFVAVALMSSVALGYLKVFRYALSLFIPVDPAFLYFHLPNWWAVLYIFVLLLLSSCCLYFAATTVLNRTPGDLFYGRITLPSINTGRIKS